MFGEFWNFTWWEMGSEDLPAAITYILDVSNQTQWVSHPCSDCPDVFPWQDCKYWATARAWPRTTWCWTNTRTWLTKYLSPPPWLRSPTEPTLPAYWSSALSSWHLFPTGWRWVTGTVTGDMFSSQHFSPSKAHFCRPRVYWILWQVSSVRRIPAARPSAMTFSSQYQGKVW